MVLIMYPPPPAESIAHTTICLVQVRNTVKRLLDAFEDFRLAHTGALAIAKTTTCGPELLDLLGLSRISGLFGEFSPECEAFNQLLAPTRPTTRDVATNYTPGLNNLQGHTYKALGEWSTELASAQAVDPAAELSLPQEKRYKKNRFYELAPIQDHLGLDDSCVADRDNIYGAEAQIFRGIPNPDELVQPVQLDPDLHRGRFGQLRGARTAAQRERDLCEVLPPCTPGMGVVQVDRRAVATQAALAFRVVMGYAFQLPCPSRDQFQQLLDFSKFMEAPTTQLIGAQFGPEHIIERLSELVPLSMALKYPSATAAQVQLLNWGDVREYVLRFVRSQLTKEVFYWNDPHNVFGRAIESYQPNLRPPPGSDVSISLFSFISCTASSI